MIEVNGNLILTPIYQILLDLQAELKYSGSHLLHTIKPPHSYGDIIVSCPVHNNGKEQHPSASITTREKHKGDKVIPAGFMYCFSCKSKMTIDNLIYDHTIIIVAHRLSTIVDADIIHVVNEGMLESSGTHKELLDKSKVYQRLYANEKKEI